MQTGEAIHLLEELWRVHGTVPDIDLAKRSLPAAMYGYIKRLRGKGSIEVRHLFTGEVRYSAASAYSVTGGHEQTRLRSP
jgi:hypothetical protein